MKKVIGRGAFSVAYQVADDAVELHSECPAKEAYALFSQGNPLAPVIAKTYQQNRTGREIYAMPLYPKFKRAQLNPEAKALYDALRDLFLQIMYWKNQDYYALSKHFESMATHNVLTEEQAENLQSLLSDVCNAIDPSAVRFEISPRNASYTPTGDLVLLDCFFDSTLVFRKSF